MRRWRDGECRGIFRCAFPLRGFDCCMQRVFAFLAAIFALAVGAQEAKAQWTFADFAATNKAQTKAFAVAFADGASAQYFFRYSIATSGVISGRGVRYDLAKGSASASPTNGKTVTIVSRDSRLGNPIRAVKDQYSTNLYCPFSLTFSDGAMVKGVMERGLRDYAAYTRMEGTMAYKGAVGSTLSLSNPY
jgi:hypothetical protein